MKFRDNFAIFIFFILLIFGPIDCSGTAGLIVRIGYVLLIPAIFWFLLKWVWEKRKPSMRLEENLNKGINGSICVILVVIAVLDFVADSHVINDNVIRNQYGMEAVGEDIIVSGPDTGMAVFTLFFAVVIFWYGVVRRKS